MKRSMKSALALILAILMLAGCTLQRQQNIPPELPPSAATPPAISSEEEVFTTELYFLGNEYMLDEETHAITVPRGYTRAEAAMQAWMELSQRTGYKPLEIYDLEYEGMEVSGDICMIYLSGSPQREEQIMWIKAALANTMYAAAGCAYTDVLVDNAQPGLRDRALGALQPTGTDANVVYLQYPPTEGEDRGETVLETRNAVLFFTDAEGERLHADVRGMQYGINASVGDILSRLIDALTAGPDSGSGLVRILPAGMRYVNSTVRSTTAASQVEGQLTVAIPDVESSTISKMPREWGWLTIYLESDGSAFDLTAACASIVYTITGFLPKLLGVRIVLDGEPVALHTVLPAYGEGAEDTFTREMFFGRLGHTISLYVPDEGGLGLTETPRHVAHNADADLLVYVRELFEDQADWLQHSTLGPEDALSVSLQGTLAVINMREGFYNKLNAALLREEQAAARTNNARLFVFSIINTLCRIRGVERVQLLEEGQRIDKSLGAENDLERLYLGNPLYQNPGLNLRQ